MKNLTTEIIIPTYRPDTGFSELLRRLMEQTVLPERIIIMNTEKKYWEEGEVFKRLLENSGIPLEIHHIAKAEFDHGGTRAKAAAMSRADVMVFMTQDAMPADCYLLENLLKNLKEGQQKDCVAAVYGRQLPTADCRFLERYSRSFNYGPESRIKSLEDLPKMGIKTYFCSNVCAAYRRDVYEKVGGFEKSAIFNEDMIFAGHLIQAGYRVAYAADAKVIHSHNYSGLQQFHRNFDLAVSQADHPEVFKGVRSETEGIRLVKRTALHLLANKKLWLLPELLWQSGCKYLGYRMGKNYQKLPAWLIKKCTMNREYWKNNFF